MGYGEPYKKPYNNSYPRPSYKKAESTIGKELKERDARRSTEIKGYAETQSMNITIQSANRDAYAWCVNTAEWVGMSEEDRRSWVDKKVVENLTNAITRRGFLESLYDSLQTKERERAEEIRAKSQETAELEAGDVSLGDSLFAGANDIKDE